jgi:hypothetical protein
MFGALGRFLVLRVLPRRLIPILTVVEVVQLLRAARRQRASAQRRRLGPGAASDRWAPEFEAHRARARSPAPRD